MELFNTKTDRFCGLNPSQCQPFLSKPKSSNPLSLLHRKKTKKKKNKVSYQNVFKKKYRDRLTNTLKRWGTQINIFNQLQTCHFFYSIFSLQSSVFQFNHHHKKTCNWTLIWAQLCKKKKSLRNKVNFLKKNTLL